MGGMSNAEAMTVWEHRKKPTDKERAITGQATRQPDMGVKYMERRRKKGAVYS